MHTVFSHIIQKRFSQVNEDVATDALAYILESSGSAHNGMMKLLRGLVSDLPLLRFRTQQAEGTIRPDMWGYDAGAPRVFVENKFWAGLTDNQPVSYLKQLAQYGQPTILLVVAPEAREEALWRELIRRLEEARILSKATDPVAGLVHAATTEAGTVLALTSWNKLLTLLEHEAVDDQAARSNLHQLRSLCDVADREAFTPISAAQLSDQRTPTFLLQLGDLVKAALSLAVTEEAVSTTGLMPQASWERIGRYAKTVGPVSVGFWLGTHFRFWRMYGQTPLWFVIQDYQDGRTIDSRSLIGPWATKEGIFTTPVSEELAIPIDIASGEDQDRVVRNIVDQIRTITNVLSPLNPR